MFHCLGSILKIEVKYSVGNTSEAFVWCRKDVIISWKTVQIFGVKKRFIICGTNVLSRSLFDMFGQDATILAYKEK